VTLAIIGVVASLTIPGLIKNYEKQQWISKYKSTFSIISQATRMIMGNNNGSLLGAWGSFNDHQGMYNAYIPYLNVIKKCENQSAAGNCFNSNYTELDGDPEFFLGSNNTQHSVIFSNGVSLSFFSFGGATANGNMNQIAIDINGKKGPNVTGKDFFVIDITINSDPVKPFSWNETEANIISGCPSSLTGNAFALGITCGVRILRGDYAEDY